jgi:Acetyltransferase (GNAT) domain
LRVERYTTDQEQEWNDFVGRSKNGTFLFDRRYMEYHGDRFEDRSLLIRDHHDRLIALLPASRREDAVVSHGGLTYGGFVSGPQMTTTRMLDVLDACVHRLREDGIDRLVYKCVPHIYHSLPAEEDAYALFLRGARLVRRDVASAIDTRLPLPFRKGRRGALQRARNAGLRVEEVKGFDRFWPVLERNLAERYGTEPVHTLAEITYLAERFPEDILLFVCSAGAGTLAGSVLYVSTNVCHIQYNAVSPEGRAKGALDLVLATVIERFSASHRIIDFGISTERDGQYLNEGLINFKEGFGARAVNYDSYELRVGCGG